MSDFGMLKPPAGLELTPGAEVPPAIRWDRSGAVLVVAADRSLRSILQRIDAAAPDWVVVVSCDGPQVLRHAVRPAELRDHVARLGERWDWTLLDALDLFSWGSSPVARHGRLLSLSAPGRQSPITGRVVDLDADGTILAIGEVQRLARAPSFGGRGVARGKPHAGVPPEPGFDVEEILGRMRGVGAGPPPDILDSSESDGAAPALEAADAIADGMPGRVAARAPATDVILSAETGNEISIGDSQPLDVRIELTAGAQPLEASTKAVIDPGKKIIVHLSAETDALEIVGAREVETDPPTPGHPVTGRFTVKGRRVGASRLAVSFLQRGSELGVIGLAVEVVATAAQARPTQGRTTATPSEAADDDKLALLIEQRAEDGKVFYHYTLHSEALDIQYEAFDSKPLLDRGGGPAASVLAFVERIYARVTQELRSFDDLEELKREAHALGANLSRELFDPGVAGRLWPLRDKIKVIQVRSWEPYIPWEMVRLHDPATDDTDDHFLAERNLVRTLTDRPPARVLPMERWRYLGATFPNGSLPDVGAELAYFTGTGPRSLFARGVTPSRIDNRRDAFYDALGAADFDVLHISCHAESAHQSIESASLIIGDAIAPGASRPRRIDVQTEIIRDEVKQKLMGRRPLVFLNACETGRVGAVLTAWGGWPNVFMRAGAGAFVGTSWSVREKPAAAFATTFYETLWDGGTLAEAAGAARKAARDLGDASWLAFKVYGHPRARRGPPPLA